MRYELKRIAAWPFIRLGFFFHLAVGFVIGLLYALIMAFVITISSSFSLPEEQIMDLHGLSIGLLIVIVPILCAIGMAVFYTLFGLILLGLYNLVARLVGGMEFELNPVVIPSAIASAGPSVQTPPAVSHDRFIPPPPPPPSPPEQPAPAPEPPETPPPPREGEDPRRQDF